MSIGMRNERVRIFTYSNTGSDGFMASTYTYVAERWARKELPSGREITVAAQAEHKVDAVFEFAAEVTVTRNGLLKHDGDLYFVRSALKRKGLGGQPVIQVMAEYADKSNVTVTGEP
jgi:hypothetical protein